MKRDTYDMVIILSKLQVPISFGFVMAERWLKKGMRDITKLIIDNIFTNSFYIKLLG